MALAIEPETVEHVPLVRLPNGAIRVEGTRVPFEIIVYAFNRGDTPEQIVQSYPTVTLAKAYGVIAFYLNHTAEADEYLAEVEAVAAAWERKIRADLSPLGDIRKTLLSRRQAKQSAD